MDSVVNLAVGKIGELLVQEAKFLRGVEDQVEILQEELIMMNDFLNDMEALDEESGDERIRNTAKQIRRIAYDAEDVIESYILDSSVNKNDFFKRYLCFCKCLVNTHKMGAEIEVIKARITRTMDSLRRFRGESGLTAVSGMSKAKVWRPAMYSHTKEDHVVGFDEDIEKLAGSLTEKESQIQVLSIVGMGGSGKTTLVRKLYNHGSVKQCFDSITWVPISKQWVAQHGLLDILRRISRETMKSDEMVGEKIHEYLEGRKYLIVLDDVWTKEALEAILSTFPMGDNGSKIIVTTRFREVVDYRSFKVSIHEPRKLTAEESWELFRKIALSHEEDKSISPMEYAELEVIGKQMLKKCRGLPLAIVALAGLVAKKETLEEWEKVNKAMSSRVMEAGRGTQTYGAVKETLSLSYNDLPRELKSCFLYLGLFPEDCEIPIGILVRMWIAEGFISSNNLHEGETLEDLGRKYMDELIGRCMVRVARRNYEGKAKTIEIHDLMRDLCNNKAKELDFLETLSAGSSDLIARGTQTRRTIIHSYNDREFCDFSTDNRHLRSLFLFAIPYVGDISRFNPEEGAQLSLQPILKNFKLLRVLNLVRIKTCDGTLPKEIGSLILLRYLGLMLTNITQLPSSIGSLRNLLTLDYRCVDKTEVDTVEEIPNVLCEIEGLRHIYLPQDPLGDVIQFDTLHQLQTLSVGGGSWMLDQLPKLSASVQKLHIFYIPSNELLEVVFRCPSIKFDRLHSLYLGWYTARETQGEDQSEGEDEYVVGEDDTVLKNLECIVNSRHLRKLELKGTIDDKSGCFQFPFGIKMLSLSFTKLTQEATLEALGRLPSLKVLVLGRNSYFGTKWTIYEGLFSKLNELSVFDLPKLAEWSIKKGALCQLKMLIINGCKRLTSLPQGLNLVTTLKELGLQEMKPELYRKLREEGGEDAHLVRHIPCVYIPDDIDD